MSITVGIPFYFKSKADHLELAIKSVLDQSIPIDKIHLIQNGDVPNEIVQVVRDNIPKY